MDPAVEKFKQDLIAKQVSARRAQGKVAILGLPPDDILTIANGKPLHKDVAPRFTKMWETLDPLFKSRNGFTPSDSVGVASGYRSAAQDEIAWHRAFPKYYAATRAQREATEDKHGPEAVEIIFKHMNGLKAPPGFSGHTHGIAVDLTTTENGRTWHVNSDYAHQIGWQGTWLYDWLCKHAADHGFYQLRSETWHWEWHSDEADAKRFNCWPGNTPAGQRKKNR